MTDIERLEKYIRQRKKWRYWATPRDTTDLQVLRRQERIMWEAIIVVILGLFCMGGRRALDPLNLTAAVGGLGFIVYLWMEASRISKLREMFDPTAVQNATDLLDQLKRRDAAAAPQDTLPSAAARGMRKGESTTDIERLEKYVRWREKWKGKELMPPREKTDMQFLRKQEHNAWRLMILFVYFLLRLMASRIESEPYPYHQIGTLLALGFIVYLGMDVCRTARLREIFERTAVQNASDLINELKTRDAAAVPQDIPAS